LSQLPDRFIVKAVTFVEAVRNIVLDPPAQHGQQMPQDRDTGYAVYIIIAVNGDQFAVGEPTANSFDGTAYLRQSVRLDQVGKLG